MNITPIGRKPEPLPSASITAPPPETSGQIVKLSSFTQDHREQFLADVNEMEKILASLPAVRSIRRDSAADVVLAHRMTAIARGVTAIAVRLRERD